MADPFSEELLQILMNSCRCLNFYGFISFNKVYSLLLQGSIIYLIISHIENVSVNLVLFTSWVVNLFVVVNTVLLFFFAVKVNILTFEANLEELTAIVLLSHQ